MAAPSPAVVERPDVAPSVSIILPAYNESAIIARTVEELDKPLRYNFGRSEIIIIDDGSTDDLVAGLSDVSAGCTLVVVRRSERGGKGSAIRSGIALASGRIVAYTDADLPISAASVVDCIGKVAFEGYDLCVGNRFDRYSSRVGRGHLARQFFGWGNRQLAKAALRGALQDPACCVKAFTTRIAKAMATRATVNGFAFDLEAAAIALQFNLNACQIPVEWTDKRRQLPAAEMYALLHENLRTILRVRRGRLTPVHENRN